MYVFVNNATSIDPYMLFGSKIFEIKYIFLTNATSIIHVIVFFKVEYIIIHYLVTLVIIISPKFSEYCFAGRCFVVYDW